MRFSPRFAFGLALVSSLVCVGTFLSANALFAAPERPVAALVNERVDILTAGLSGARDTEPFFLMMVPVTGPSGQTPATSLAHCLLLAKNVAIPTGVEWKRLDCRSETGDFHVPLLDT